MIKMKSSSIKYNHIAIEGNIGSGKTTLAKKLSKDLESRLLLEEFAENPFLPKFYKSPEENALPLELFFMAERYHQLKASTDKDLFMPLRLALTGKGSGPELKYLIPLLKKDKILKKFGQ